MAFDFLGKVFDFNGLLDTYFRKVDFSGVFSGFIIPPLKPNRYKELSIWSNGFPRF